MRKNIRRIFSIILAAILLLCASLPVFAKSEKCSCGTPPVIYVAALGSAKLYLDKGTETLSATRSSTESAASSAICRWTKTATPQTA